jgi:hypothetical protein
VKVKDVPQEGNKAHWGKHKALYAQDEDGSYQIVPSLGWGVEEIALLTMIDDLQDRTNESKALYKEGKLSPLSYHMYSMRMDLPMLAKAAGIARWRVRRHMKPKIFARLKTKTLQKYADVLDMSIEELKRIDDE